jgi:hypothetical protein
VESNGAIGAISQEDMEVRFGLFMLCGLIAAFFFRIERKGTIKKGNSSRG